MNYKFQLQTMKKGNLSMKDYVMQMKAISDNLAAYGCPIPEEGQILSIAGLRPEYEPSTVVLTSKVTAITLGLLVLLYLLQKIELFNNLSYLSLLCRLMLLHITKYPGTVSVAIRLLVEVVMATMDNTIVAIAVVAKGVPSKVILFSNFVAKVIMLFKNVINALIFRL